MVDEPKIEFRHWPLCLALIRVPWAAGGHHVKCPVCGKHLRVPLNTDQKTAAAKKKDEWRAEARLEREKDSLRVHLEEREAAREQYERSRIECQVCHKGALGPERVYRMSPMVVFIGYIIIVPDLVMI